MPTAIIQARMSSSRLPGKVLQDIAGQPMLVHVIERARRALSVDQTIIATTTHPSDDAIQQFCADRGYLCYRGSLKDVLDRYFQAARQYAVNTVIRLTADCPLLDPGVLDLTVAALSSNDFAANRLPPPWTRTLPIGLDVEVVTFAALERAWKEAHRETYQREHVLPYIYENAIFENCFIPVACPEEPGAWSTQTGITPRGARLIQLHHSPDYGSLRWTVDTPADLELVRNIFTLLAPEIPFNWRKVLDLIDTYPELQKINQE